jgi:hypothetical protein
MNNNYALSVTLTLSLSFQSIIATCKKKGVVSEKVLNIDAYNNIQMDYILILKLEIHEV